MNRIEPFDIRNYLDRLNILKEESTQVVCECPVCGGHRLTINKKSGAYKCWSGDCAVKDIREEVSPMNEIQGDRLGRYIAPVNRPKTNKLKQSAPILAASCITLASLPAPPNIPQKQRRLDPQRGEVWETRYPYSATEWVQRTEWVDSSKAKGRDKKTLPYHVTGEGEIKCGKGQASWLPYRFNEIEQYGSGNWIVGLEGENCVDAARQLQLVSFTFQGGSWTGVALERAMLKMKQIGVAGVVYFPDYDDAGRKKAQKVALAADKAGLPLFTIDPLALWQDMPEAGDIVDWIAWGKAQGMNQDDFIQRLEQELHRACSARLEEQKRSDPDERLRLELHALLKESDPIKRMRRRAEICSHYRLKTSDITEALKHLEASTRTKESHCWSLGELFDLPRTGINYLIDGMLPASETVLLVADPKSGKTLLAYDAAYAIATGEDTFLGETTKQGKVLIIQCDESRSTAIGRLIKRGFRREDTDNVQFMDAFSISQLSLLEERLETFRPTLVIIDSLRRINAGRDVSENSAEFTDTLYQLKELLTRYGAAGIVIHHANKNKDAVGVGRVRGSSAIAGAVWGVWQLDHIPKRDPNNKKRLIIDPKDPTRILSITARDIEGQRLKIELDPDRNQWINLGEEGVAAEELGDRAAQADLILNLLKPIAPNGLEASEINEKLTLGRGIYSVLNRLLNKGIIGSRPSAIDKRRTVYYYPSEKKGDTPPPPLPVLDAIEYSESITTQSLQRSITDRSQIDHRSIATGEKEVVRSIPNPVIASCPEVDHILATEGGGVGVNQQQSAMVLERTVEGIAQNDLVENVEQLPTPDILAAQISRCQTWTEALQLIDDAAVAVNKKRITVYKTVLNQFSPSDRQQFLDLLNAYIAQFPQDKRAAKALLVANSIESRNNA
ncbi:MAG: AAA family ATPase [Chroococcidiopsis sp.]